MQEIHTEVLVVGGGTGGTAAALQAARRGAQTVLVSEFPWLGGMLTSAGVTAPDGNELAAFQTGIWGAFLRELATRQPEGLDHAWVSFFTYDPRIGAQIFADWAAALPNLKWIAGQVPLEVLRQGDRITGVRFADFTITAQIVLDGTELGDVLALADVPYRWGWEWQSEFNEPSAPTAPSELTQRYPVQAPTWVVVMQDFGEETEAPEILPPPDYAPDRFSGAWDKYGGEKFLNYGRLPGNRFMINWPLHGNDYGEGVQRLVGSATERQQFLQEARWHTQGFAYSIQQQLGRRYGLAVEMFPTLASLGGGGYALHPYYRESRRLRGLVTLREQDILPIGRGSAAALPTQTTAEGCLEVESLCTAIAIGNYPNDHHYPIGEIPLQPKSMRWGGRWTGTPFTIPYGCLVPANVDGLLACEKNISVTHIANGATRLQPVVLGIGQAAGMAAALCVEQRCQPRSLNVRLLQDALLQDTIAPAAVVPLWNLPPNHPEWGDWQRYYLQKPEAYPANGACPTHPHSANRCSQNALTLTGTFVRRGEQSYTLRVRERSRIHAATASLVTLDPAIHQQLSELVDSQAIAVMGRWNPSGLWFLVEQLQQLPA